MKQLFNFLSVIVVIIGALFLGSSYYWYSPFFPKVMKAVAVVHPTQGNTASGVVVFEHGENGVLVTAKLQGLTPGEHGFHIHEFGDCACPDANCAGSHFNPKNKQHGGPDNQQRHVGDMGNVHADDQGNAQLEYVDPLITLNGPLSVIGRTVIVHEKRDDLVSQPTGDAGARIGCGVIGIAK
jgi:Cu-Zn family superoxide dismutase